MWLQEPHRLNSYFGKAHIHFIGPYKSLVDIDFEAPSLARGGSPSPTRPVEPQACLSWGLTSLTRPPVILSQGLSHSQDHDRPQFTHGQTAISFTSCLPPQARAFPRSQCPSPSPRILPQQTRLPHLQANVRSLSRYTETAGVRDALRHGSEGTVEELCG